MDFHLVQALQETRRLAEDHAGEEGWDELGREVDDVLAKLTTDADDPTTPSLGAQRLDATVELPDDAHLAAAALTAVHDRPEPEQLELARDAVQHLHEAIS